MGKKLLSSWEGIFDSWESARGSGTTWSSDRWKNRVISQLEVYNQEKSKDTLTKPPRPSTLPVFCSILKPKTIIDFGGSSGWVWLYLKESIDTKTIQNYTVIENDSVCKLCSKYFENDSKINFSTVDQFEGECDILYINSVLQYINDSDFFELINKFSPKYVLIEDLLAGKFNDFYSLQIYYEDRIPVKFRNFNKFLNNLEKKHYSLLLKKVYMAPHRGEIQPLLMNKLPKDKRLNYALTILLEKDKQD